MIHVNTSGIKKLVKQLDKLGKKESRQAVSRAIKRAATTLTKEGSQEIRNRRLVKAPAARVKEMFDTRIKARGQIRDMYAVIKISNKAISLARFWARRASPPAGKKKLSSVGHDYKLKAVKVRVLDKTQYAGGGDAFLVDKMGGGIIFMRTSKARQPIKKLWGPSASDLVIRTGIDKKLKDIGVERFEQVLAQELAYRTGMMKGSKG